MVTGYDLEHEWPRLINLFETQLARLESGLLMHSAGRDSGEFTAEWKQKLRDDITWYKKHLAVLQGGSDA
jgi:hypothetical protein